MKFTNEEVNLCKQVAERYIKPMEYGEWWISEDWWKNTKKEPLLCLMKKWIMSKDVVKQGNFPLWTISDCLEFLRERKPQMEFELLYGDNWKIIFYWMKTFEAKTPLEACLKAVLAVLEETK